MQGEINKNKAERDEALEQAGAMERLPSLFLHHLTNWGLNYAWWMPVSSPLYLPSVTLWGLGIPTLGVEVGVGDENQDKPFFICSWGTEINDFFVSEINLGYLTLRQFPEIIFPLALLASPVAQQVKNLPAMRETWVRSLSWEDPLEKGKATHSSILAWRIPWTV